MWSLVEMDWLKCKGSEQGPFFLVIFCSATKTWPIIEDWEYKPVGGPDVDKAEKCKVVRGDSYGRQSGILADLIV